MALLVLLRGVNVGKKRFSSVALAKELADLDATGIGAAGTYVVHKRVAQATLRKRIADWLPFECEILFATDKETLAVIGAGRAIEAPEGTRAFATLMDRAPAKPPKLPWDTPEGKWGIRVAAFEGRFALGLRRSVVDAGAYPNELIEKTLGVAATTRDWPTVEKIAALLR